MAWVVIAAILKIYFELFSPEPKGKLTRIFIGSIEVTCTSKVATESHSD